MLPVLQINSSQVRFHYTLGKPRAFNPSIVMDLVNGSSTETQRQKRSRVVLSCGPCRASKLKCDRQSPCGQCTKKECADLCQYAPKPEGKKRAERRSRNMAERLKRLEGMVRGMMDEGDDAVQQNLPEKALSEGTGIQNGNITTPYVTGRLAGGYHGTYFGATHCMAMLEDVS